MTVPLRERRRDLVFLVFFAVNLLLVTYIIDLEQIVIADPRHFSYPVWPPSAMVDLVHSYGSSLDPLLMARPPFWQMTIWIDVLLFGPFYACAIYAFIRGRSWIKVPALVWSGMMLSNVLIILMDERFGVTPSPHFGLVLLLNLPWLAFPVAMILRLRRERPFERATPSTPDSAVVATA